MERWLQELVWQRAGHCCEYCRVPQERDRLPFEIDHIIELAVTQPLGPFRLTPSPYGTPRATQPDRARRPEKNDAWERRLAAQSTFVNQGGPGGAGDLRNAIRSARS